MAQKIAGAIARLKGDHRAVANLFGQFESANGIDVDCIDLRDSAVAP